jgi:very-short-patch-repair endonuclease
MGIRTRRLAQAASPYEVRTRYQQVIRGVRMPSGQPVTFRDRLDAVLLLYPDAVFCGWTAAALHGAAYCADRPIEIWLPLPRRRQGVIIHGGTMPDEDVIVVAGIRLTTGPRTFVDIARFTDGDDAVVGADQCLRRRDDGRLVTTEDEVTRYLDSHPHLHRSRRVRAVLAESDGGAESPPETHTRLLLHRAGLTMFRTQVMVDRGSYRLDLGSEEFKVAVEYDGRDHADPDQQALDAARRNTLRHDHGWEVMVVTKKILAESTHDLLRQVRSALRDRGRAAA